jgi:hypothetical protein
MRRCTDAVRMDLVVCMTVLVVVSVSMGLPWMTYSLRNRGEQIGVYGKVKSYTKSFAPSCLHTTGGFLDTIKVHLVATHLAR